MHKLLSKQVLKLLDPTLLHRKDVIRFLEAIDNSYQSYERDKQLSEHAFRINEEEYSEINTKLENELSSKKAAMEELMSGIKELDPGNAFANTVDNKEDFLIQALKYINQQIEKRKQSENELQNSKQHLRQFSNMLSTLIANLNSGILLEDENRDILLTNQQFCNLFQIPAPPEALIGMNCSNSAEQSKGLFSDPENFTQSILRLIKEGKEVLNDKLEMADGRILLRDYIPILIENQHRGHLWNYKDVTEELNNMKKLERISAVASANENGVAFVNKDGIIQWMNQGFTAITGYEQSDCNTEKIWNLLNGLQSSPGSIKEAEELYSQGKSFSIELQVKRKDGSSFWSRLKGQAIHKKTDDNWEYFIVIEDINHQKEDQRKMSEYESRFRLAFEKIGDNLWEHDFRTGKTYFSNTSNHFLGYNADEFADNAALWWSRTYPEDKALLEENDRRYKNGEAEYHTLEYRLIDKEGNIRWVLDRGVVIETDKNKKPLRIIGTHTDITERKHTEQLLQINEEKYRGIIANMRLGLVEVDNEQQILFANQSFCQMSGFELEELIGKKATDFFMDAENEELINEKIKSRRGGSADAFEIKVKDKHQQEKWWLVSSAPRYDNDGKQVGSIGIHFDITSQKALERELINAKLQAESSSKSKQNFLANMSHEIRTPMNAVMGMSAELAKTQLDTRQKFFLNTIQTATENLLVIINDILDLSKIEEGKLQIEKIPFNLQTLFSRALQVMKHKAAEKGLSLTNSYFDPAIAQTLKGDPYRINQILLNLISNAIKFTDEGRVDISCLLMKTDNNQQYLFFKVIDTGKGMDEEFTKRLFDKFSQEYESNARKHGGTGLGMSICKNLVELMGGEIKVTSTKNMGTEVSFTLPLEIGSDQEEQIQQETIMDTKNIKGIKILVVDDNEMNRLVATTMLSHYDIEITEATNGQEAIDQIKANEPDLVLMDIQMPGMSGIEATGIIRKDITQTLPIVALTANAIKGENLKCMQAGMNDYLSKPFEEKDLVQMIHKWTNTGMSASRDSISSPSPANNEQLYSLQNLREIGKGNQAFVTKMINLFQEQVPRAVEDIRSYYDKNEMEKLSETAHRIKPIIKNLSISSIYEEISEMEELALTQGSGGRLKQHIDKLETIIQKVSLQLSAELSEKI